MRNNCGRTDAISVVAGAGGTEEGGVGREGAKEDAEKLAHCDLAL